MYCSDIEIRKVTTDNHHRILVVKTIGGRSLVKPRRSWKGKSNVNPGGGERKFESGSGGNRCRSRATMD